MCWTLLFLFLFSNVIIAKETIFIFLCTKHFLLIFLVPLSQRSLPPQVLLYGKGKYKYFTTKGYILYVYHVRNDSALASSST